MVLSEGFSNSNDFYYRASGGVLPSNDRTPQPPTQTYETSESTTAQESMISFPPISQLSVPDYYNYCVEEPSDDVVADVVQTPAGPSGSWLFNAASEPPRPDYTIASQYSSFHGLTPVAQIDEVWGNDLGQWDAPNSSFVPHNTPESFDSSLQLQDPCTTIHASSGLQDTGFLFPGFQRDMGPTHSRNSSFSQSSAGSGPSTGWVTDELSDGLSAPSTPFLTPSSSYSALQSDQSPASTSSALPFRMSGAQRKTAREAVEYLAQLEENHGRAALPKVAKQRTWRNHEASVFRRSDRSKIVVCPVPECGETYTRLSNLKVHLERHFPRERMMPQCPHPGCSYESENKSSMARHKKSKHPDP